MTGESDDLPPEVRAAQLRVTLAIADLVPPAGFGVLIDVLAEEMVAHGMVPGTPLFESFVRLQIEGLVGRCRAICAERGVEIEEEEEEVEPAIEDAPPPKPWWALWGG